MENLKYLDRNEIRAEGILFGILIPHCIPIKIDIRALIREISLISIQML